ncbi:DUF4833 domain-containing protein [Soonwooa sp.]|uniref:DUF4833 domain-containing protein n=1 Tax=Soonwooa sp. TaxID=1938592 RepID=UPI00289ECB93|nr:DUF4833 domain-containing protein [Soonwooa sp.]
MNFGSVFPKDLEHQEQWRKAIIYLEKMFIQLKNSGLKPSADYILLTGKDFETGKNVSEKVKI